MTRNFPKPASDKRGNRTAVTPARRRAAGAAGRRGAGRRGAGRMPHNLVIVDSPAARQEIEIAADRMQNEPDALARGYLPDSPHILHATKLLYPKQSEVLTLTAPTEPGVYAYLCTFPGHTTVSLHPSHQMSRAIIRAKR